MSRAKKSKSVNKNQEDRTAENQKPVALEWTPEKRARFDEWKRRWEGKSIKCRKVQGKACQIEIDYDDPWYPLKQFEALGTADSDLQTYLLEQVIATFPGAGPMENRNPDVVLAAANTALAVLGALRPRDEMEAMLMVQTIGVHNLLMDALRGAIVQGQTLEWKKHYANCAAKMARMFLDQMEQLRRYRGGHQQKMTIEHVHVNEGGQAIVGNVQMKAGTNGQENR